LGGSLLYQNHPCFIRIIPERGFSSGGMKLAGENHPWERNFIGRDETGRRESSLGEKFHREG